jgi:hypothetical protein
MIEHGLLSFGSLLQEKLDELEADESSQDVLECDPVERLRLDAKYAVLAARGSPMPRGGHQAYIDPPSPPAAPPGQRHLNILH